MIRIGPYVGSVFQNPKSQFYTLLTDTEIVLAYENLGLDRGDILSRFEKTVTALRLEKLLGKCLFVLSGGEKQKIVCTSVCALMPDVFVFNEPTSGLDYQHMQELASSIRKLSDMGKTQFIITHDPHLVAACCNYFVFMKAGKVVRSGYWNEENRKYIADYFGEL